MEPRLPTSEFSPDMNPNIQKEGSKNLESGPETRIKNDGNKAPGNPEASSQSISGQVSVAAQQASQAAQSSSQMAMPIVLALQDDDAPLDAKDEDLIEKEWVVKAKSIVESTRSDPYQQEEAVSKLQREYLKKRYGKELRSTTEL